MLGTGEVHGDSSRILTGRPKGTRRVILPLDEETPGIAGLDGAVLRRRSARPTKRVVIHLDCMGRPVRAADLAGWYTDRGFHFYVAALRRLGDPGAPAAGQPGRGTGRVPGLPGLRAAHVRDADGIETVPRRAHGTGALIAAPGDTPGGAASRPMPWSWPAGAVQRAMAGPRAARRRGGAAWPAARPRCSP